MTVDQEARHQTDRSARNGTYTMRPIEASDGDIVATWFQQIEDVSIFDRQVPLPVNHGAVAELIKTMITDQKKNKCCWFITETRHGEAVGIAGLESISTLHGNALLPVFIAEPWRSTGLGIRMACMMIDLGFKQLRLHRISTIYRSDNTASESLTKRLGFRLEGTTRQAWFSQGEYHDLRNVGLLESEWAIASKKLRNELSYSLYVELGPRPTDLWRWP